MGWDSKIIERDRLDKKSNTTKSKKKLSPIKKDKYNHSLNINGY